MNKNQAAQSWPLDFYQIYKKFNLHYNTGYLPVHMISTLHADSLNGAIRERGSRSSLVSLLTGDSL